MCTCAEFVLLTSNNFSGTVATGETPRYGDTKNSQDLPPMVKLILIGTSQFFRVPRTWTATAAAAVAVAAAEAAVAVAALAVTFTPLHVDCTERIYVSARRASSTRGGGERRSAEATRETPVLSRGRVTTIRRFSVQVEFSRVGTCA